MQSMTTNEMQILLKICKEYTKKYNANNLAKAMGLSAMGTHKILQRLETQGLVSAEQIGRAKIFRINYRNTYTRRHLSFLLAKEAEEAAPRARRWIVELQKLEPHAQTGILFGSALDAEHQDVDVLVVLEQSQLKGMQQQLAAINRTSTKHIHTIKQKPEDLVENLRNHEKVIVNALQHGIVLFGQKRLVELMAHVTR